MKYRIDRVEVPRYPVLKVTFDDGLSGEFDLSDLLAEGPLYAPLQDPAVFRTVTVAEGGRRFGWLLGEEGREIDFCPDTARIAVETKLVEDMATAHRARRSAAE
ncbi:MAG: DUF2442 domain-containing protein [Hyphomicrobiaceae bacterium]|nr:DUF2442 domain-containing protein [Hyphomicrobiaceae bacterium]